MPQRTEPGKQLLIFRVFGNQQNQLSQFELQQYWIWLITGPEVGMIDTKYASAALLLWIGITGATLLTGFTLFPDLLFNTSQMNSSGKKNKTKQKSVSLNCSTMQAPFLTNTQLPF
ncbi:MAG: hypothetical protein J7578_15950 [Chitinophagaceae bacterium]|nr:hypothetical protein [Chitinophagaceae bacterium]